MVAYYMYISRKMEVITIFEFMTFLTNTNVTIFIILKLNLKKRNIFD